MEETLLSAAILAFYKIVGLDLAHKVSNNEWNWPEDAPQVVDLTAEKLRKAIKKELGL